MRRGTRIGAALLLAVVVPLSTAACGTARDEPAPPAPAPVAVQAGNTHNDADVMYLQMMVAHHGQGLQLVRLAKTRAQREEIKTLAAAVEATQGDEVTMMKSWLDTWSKPTTVDHDPGSHAAHGGLPATGAEQIAALEKAAGADFDRQFLNLFVGHQHNAVEMSQREAKEGANPETKEFARRVQESRIDQIAQMLAFLNG
ncbi:DUF305 domain-containing protein [Micromonospora sp. WMMC415]|uniref:DUF305 domain-containing protein n=1 Tax=Micromonospora sp. WMMC415 TaxID=2675222 RepID=UPI0012B48514|nr:DUF305 domain-containing protein [Micromonospora sp. WMMC415]QGN49166.1 DUF305 domain-containing protein [Micromonospora sp. WMMC415]